MKSPIRWRSALFTTGLLLLVLALLVLLAFWLPRLLMGGLEGLSAAEQINARNSLGSNLVGGAVVASAAATAIIGWRTYRVSRESRWTEQFEGAVKDLAVDSPLLEIAALARLRSLSIAWPAGRQLIAEAVSAYLRSRGTGARPHEVEVDLAEVEAVGPFPNAAYAFGLLVGLGSDMRGDLVVDLRKSNFRGIELHDLDLNWARFFGADFSLGKIVRCNLRGVSVRRADLTGATFRSCDLANAALDGARAEGLVVRDSTFSDASAVGLMANGAALSSQLDRTNFQAARFRGADFRGSTLAYADLRDASLVGAILDGVDLRKSMLAGADLTAARLSRDLIDASQLSDVRGGEFIRWTDST